MIQVSYENFRIHEQYEILDSVIYWGLDALCLDDLDATLTVTNMMGILEGSGRDADMYFDGVDEFHMRLWTLDEKAILHELVHMMQYAAYELEVYREGEGYWQGKNLTGLTYEESPWEVEAHRLEEILVKEYQKHLDSKS